MGDLLIKLLENNVLVTALLSNIIAQILKVIIHMLIKKKFDFSVLVSSGGMPSAHSAMVTAVATAVGRYDGWNSPIFGLAVIFAMIVMYDAAGVRRAAGKQAEILNQLVDDIYHHRNEKTQARLKELLGHTPVEVVAGAILGILIATWL